MLVWLYLWKWLKWFKALDFKPGWPLEYRWHHFHPFIDHELIEQCGHCCQKGDVPPLMQPCSIPSSHEASWWKVAWQCHCCASSASVPAINGASFNNSQHVDRFGEGQTQIDCRGSPLADAHYSWVNKVHCVQPMHVRCIQVWRHTNGQDLHQKAEVLTLSVRSFLAGQPPSTGCSM